MKENVVIIGGGIAGIEAAKQLLLLGYSPIIVEKQDHLGGHVAEWHKLFPDMTPAKEIVDQMTSEIGGANVFLETTVSSLNRLSNGYSVVLSNGIAIVCRAILIATGFHLFDAEKKEEYGYGVYNQVITNRDLEHWFNSGKDVRIDGREMKKIGFVAK